MSRIQSVPMLMLALGAGLGRTQTPQAPEIQVITGRPFTADATTVRTQTLAHRNHVIHTMTSFFARDTEGRTRMEETIDVAGSTSLPGDSKKVIFITDPVASTNYVLESNHRARRIVIAAGSEMHRSSAAGRRVFSSSEIESLGTEMIEGLRAEGTRTTEVIPAGQVGNARPLEITYERWYSRLRFRSFEGAQKRSRLRSNAHDSQRPGSVVSKGPSRQ
jgi:hypothetical protein